jgi:DNA-binding NarL/FixJ family response regulator
MSRDRSGPIRVVIADDHTVVREGIRALLEKADDILVVGEAADGQMALDLVEELSPHVLLVDIRMPRLDGIQTVERLVARQAHPSTGGSRSTGGLRTAPTAGADPALRTTRTSGAYPSTPGADPALRTTALRTTRTPGAYPSTPGAYPSTPGAEAATRVVILSMYSDVDLVRCALIAGAMGYLLKDSLTEELLLAIRAAARGEPYISPSIARVVLDDFLEWQALFTVQPDSAPHASLGYNVRVGDNGVADNGVADNGVGDNGVADNDPDPKGFGKPKPSTPRADPALRTTSTPRADPSTPRADPSTPRAGSEPVPLGRTRRCGQREPLKRLLRTGEPLGRTPVPLGRMAYRLTPREREVLQLIAEGYTNLQMAELLGISYKTVEKHRSNLMSKLDVHDVTSLLEVARAQRLIFDEG